MIVFYFKTAIWLSKNSNKNDVVVASSPHIFAPFTAARMKNRIGYRLITEVRDLWPDAFITAGLIKKNSSIHKILLKMEKYIYVKSDKIVFLKPGDFQYLVDESLDNEVEISKTTYINNGIDVESFNRILESNIYSYKNYKKINVTYVGSLRPMNNIELILETARKMKNTDEVMFHIFGSGPCIEEYRDFILTHSLTNIHFYGAVSRDQIPSILKQSTYNLLNYSQNSYNWSRGNSSNKLFEYLAAGSPIISTIKMGYSIIDEFKCGFTTAENDSDSLMNLLQNLVNLDDTEYQRYQRNVNKALKEFDYSNLSNKYLKVINELT